MSSNIKIQIFLNEHIKQYAEYINDWALIQSVILSILIHYDFGKKRQDRYEAAVKRKEIECCAILEMIDIIEYIYADDELLNIICKTQKNKDIIITQHNREQLMYFYKKVLDIKKIVADTSFSELLTIPCLEVLLGKRLSNIIISVSE